VSTQADELQSAPSTAFTLVTVVLTYLSVLTIQIHLPIGFDHPNRTIRA
jgi:hypothetical protein